MRGSIEPSISRPARMRGEIEGYCPYKMTHMCQFYATIVRSDKIGNSRFEYTKILKYPSYRDLIGTCAAKNI
jgi:hypothetical protein